MAKHGEELGDKGTMEQCLAAEMLANQIHSPQNAQSSKPSDRSTQLQRAEPGATYDGFEFGEQEQKSYLPSPETSSKVINNLSQTSPTSENRPTATRKRKQTQEAEDYISLGREELDLKRLRSSPPSSAFENISDYSLERNTYPINYWINGGSWPTFAPDIQTKKEPDRDSTFKELFQLDNMIGKKRSTTALDGCEDSATIPSAVTSSDQKSREEKSAPYAHPSYVTTVLIPNGCHMSDSTFGIIDESELLCQVLLDGQVTVPEDSLFQDGVFELTCESVRLENEARVVRDISPLICPSAVNSANRGAQNLRHLIETVNAGWNSAMALSKPRPQPDFSVGFKSSAFSEVQLAKLRPLVGGLSDTSFYMATWQMYFPFLTCEVKCGTGSLYVADRQNAHSMTLAVRAFVELYRSLGRGREVELSRKILAFSISHDHETVKIYGHYPVIDGAQTTYFRHTIKEFNITNEKGKERWTAYKFTMNVYNVFMPKLLDLITSAIDDIPADMNFAVTPTLAYCGHSADGGSDGQSIGSSVDSLGNKKRRLPQTAVLKQEIERQRAQYDKLLESSNHKHDQLIEFHRQESERQRAQYDQLIESNKQLMELLRQKSASST